MNQPDEFIPNHFYRIAYKPTRHAGYHSGFDVELVCPNCGETNWSYKDRSGTGKLPKDQMKFKCGKCGQFFIANRNEITKIIGL